MQTSGLMGVCLAVMLGGFFGTSSASAQEDIIWLDYPASGVVLGQGYDTLGDRATYGTCVNFVPVQDPSQEVRYRLEEVNSRTELLSVTNISASGAMKMAILKATARLSYLSDAKFSSATTKFWLNATVTNSSLFAAPSVDFKQAVQVLGKNSDGTPIDYSKFHRIEFKFPNEDKDNISKCGHGFVGVIVSGAAIDAFLTYSKADTDSLALIKGGLEADIAGIFSVSGSFEQRQKAVSAQDSIQISLYRYGGAAGTIAYDLAGLKQSVSALTTEASTAPKPVKIGIIPYSALSVAPEAAGLDAQRYSAAVAAYFMTVDVFNRSGDYIDSYFDYLSNPMDADRTKGGAPIFLAADLKMYVDLNAEALQEANRLSRILSLCKDEATAHNMRVSEASIGGSATFDVAALEAARDLGTAAPKAQKVNVSTVRGVSPTATQSQYDSVYAALSVRDPSVSGTARATADAGAQESCLIKEGTLNTFLLNAPQRAIALAAREISLRPIYWVEIGKKYKEALTVIRDRYAEGKDPNTVQAAALDTLDEFNDVYRAADLRRVICRRSFEHPICAIDQADFQTLAKLPREGVIIDFKQLALELQP